MSIWLQNGVFYLFGQSGVFILDCKNFNVEQGHHMLQVGHGHMLFTWQSVDKVQDRTYSFAYRFQHFYILVCWNKVPGFFVSAANTCNGLFMFKELLYHALPGAPPCRGRCEFMGLVLQFFLCLCQCSFLLPPVGEGCNSFLMNPHLILSIHASPCKTC